jgi:flagellar hook assembly protein FlgD
LLRDIRSDASSQNGIWDIDVTPAVTGPLALRVTPVSIPKDSRITLTDKQSGIRHSINQNGQVAVQGAAGKPMRFQLTIGAKSSVQLQVKNIRIHAPGRSSGATRIVVQTTRSAETSAEVQTLTGQRVAMLAASRAASGMESTFIWDGRGADGKETPAGNYVLHITMVDEDGNQIVTTRPLTRLR